MPGDDPVFAVTALSGSAQGTSSVTWSWSDARNLYVDGYALEDSLGNVLGSVANGVFVRSASNCWMISYPPPE